MRENNKKVIYLSGFATRIAVMGFLLAFALILSYVEHVLSLSFAIPGAKLGLAHLITVMSLLLLDRRSALLILVSRCLLANLLFGSVTSLLFSLGGGFLAFVVMVLLLRGYPKRLSLVGVCVGGAAAHHVGQIAVACLLFQTTALLAYLPVLLLVAVVTGSVIGYLSIFAVQEAIVKRMTTMQSVESRGGVVGAPLTANGGKIPELLADTAVSEMPPTDGGNTTSE